LTEVKDGTTCEDDFPVQTQDLVIGIPQPGRNFSRLKRPISRTQVAIEQLCDFFNSAGLFDLVQRSKNVLVEAALRMWNLTHLGFSGLMWIC